jgi:hypothetical protein
MSADQSVLVLEAGLQDVSKGGVMFKPRADFQMDKMFETGSIGEISVL